MDDQQYSDGNLSDFMNYQQNQQQNDDFSPPMVSAAADQDGFNNSQLVAEQMNFRYNKILNDFMDSDDDQVAQRKGLDLEGTAGGLPLNDLEMCDFDDENNQMDFNTHKQEYSRPQTPIEQQDSFNNASNPYVDEDYAQQPRQKFNLMNAVAHEQEDEDDMHIAIQGIRNVKKNQFFFHEDMIIDDEQSGYSDDQQSNNESRRSHNRQDEQDNDDNYDNIGKWEELNKENEINEIESLEFSVKREEFQDSQYESQPAIQNINQSVTIPTSGITGESLYQSPNKKVISKVELNKSLHQPAPSIKSEQIVQPEQKRPPIYNSKEKSQNKQQTKLKEKQSIQKIKDLFQSEEKFQKFERLHSSETVSSSRKRKGQQYDLQASQSYKDCTFQPRIDPISNIITTSQMDDTQLTQRTIDPCIFLYQRGVQLRDKKQKELEEQKKLNETSKLQECSFRPNTHRGSEQSLKSTDLKQFYDRNLHWDEQRKNKIIQEREKCKQQELQSCSFTPNIRPQSSQGFTSMNGNSPSKSNTRRNNQSYSIVNLECFDSRVSRGPPQTDRSHGNTTKQFKSMIKKAESPVPIKQDRSVKLYIERLQKAKQQKIDKDLIFEKNDGSKWKNQVTKPNPPKITDIIIQNLQKRLNNNNKPEIKETKLKSGRQSIQKDQRKNSQDSQHHQVSSFIQQTPTKAVEFKDAVQFLRHALHSLDLDSGSQHPQQRISNQFEADRCQYSPQSRNIQKSPSSSCQNTQLQSERVMQLKKEIEELDMRLQQTTTFQLDDVRSSHHYPSTTNKNRTIDILSSQYEQREHTGQKICETSSDYQVYNQRDNQQDVLRNSVHIYKQIQNNATTHNSQNKQNILNASHFTQEPEISFDIEKIAQSKNLNLKSALERNLYDKRQLIQDVQIKIQQIKKECDAKYLKLNHLQFERENIINSIQVDSLKKSEQEKQAKEQVKRIEVKKREEQRAYSIAQNEIKRQIIEQEQILDSVIIQFENIQKEYEEVKSKAGPNFTHQTSKTNSNELNEKINQHQTKILSLTQKKHDVENNIKILKDFLKSIGEEIQMTQEDLSGKLMQRAEFVAQREELDQMYDSGRQAFGKCFELYLKINDINGGSSCGSNTTRYLSKDYENEKSLSFFQNLLQQIKQQSKSKYHDSIDTVYSKIENSTLTTFDIDKSIGWVCQLAQSLNIQLDKQVLLRRFDLSNKEKDEMFLQRQQQLKDIILEIKRFEQLIKENSNLVDNMILPQLKAMSTTYQEHKGKYKKLKQAQFVLKERLKKTERENKSLTDERDQLKSQQSAIGNNLKCLENDFKKIQERLKQEQEEMDRLNENASQIEKEYRRAHQSLLLKEREIMQKIAQNDSTANVSQSLNATQLSILSNQRQQEIEDERLKKRFQDIEEKIRITLVEKEEVDQKLNDYQRLFKETKESCDHAEQVVMNSHRVMNSTSNLPQNRRSLIGTAQVIEDPAYQATSFTDHDIGDYPMFNGSANNQKFRLQNQVNFSSRQHIHKQSLSSTGHNLYQFGGDNMVAKSQQFGDNKENLLRPSSKMTKESMTKLDLSKILANKEQSNQVSTYSGQRSMSNSKSFEPINYYDKNQKQYSDHHLFVHGQQDSTTFNENSTSSANLPQANKQSVSHTMNIFNEDLVNMLQQSRYMEKSQDNNESSMMNLSDLIVNNYPAVLNIMEHKSRVKTDSMQIPSNLTFKNSRDQPQMRQYSQQSNNKNLHSNQQSLLDPLIVEAINQSSNIDSSLIQYLDDMNINAAVQGDKRTNKLPAMRRTSIETAEFIHDEFGRKHTIDVDLSHREQFENVYHPGYYSTNNKEYRQMPISQSISHSTQRSNNNSNQQTWMSKYLNAGNEFSRMYGTGLQDNVSPQPNLRKGSKLKQMSWNNRSSSHEHRYASYGGQQKVNASTNSISSIGNFATLHNQSYIGDRSSHTRSGSRQNKKARKLNKSMNGGDSSTLIQQSITSAQLLNPVAMSMNFGQNIYANNQSNQNLFGQECIQFSKIDVSFAERIIPLLDGAAFYKKFSSRQSLNENAFDPLNADKIPPESCGYGIRLFQLDKSLLCINVRMSLKIAVETTISLNDIVKPILPQTTMDIIRAQKNYVSHQPSGIRKNSRNSHLSQPQLSHMCVSSSTKDLLEEFLILESKGSISHLAKIGIVNKNSELYRQKCVDSTFYPFSIALTNGRVELIATSYETLKNWIIGINLLVSNKKHIPKLKQLMELKLE